MSPENRPSFNVISSPWIPVETEEGDTLVLGIREALLRAHELRGICAASPLFSYGMQRILIAFLIDAFRPVDTEALSELIRKGRFDGQTIDAYIGMCGKNGECFDLFDEKRPFLQTTFEEQDENEDYIVRLFAELPEGNNHVHFCHMREDSHIFTPAECAQALCALSAYALNFARSTHFGINGMPPIYFLHAGETLFYTLACSMVALSELQGMSLDDPPVAWRLQQCIPEGETIARVSLLHGLTCQPRRIQLLPEKTERGIILRKMRYAKGWDYKAVSNWRDPHVAYYLDDKGVLKPLRPRESRAVWRDLGRILPKSARPTIMNNSQRKLAAGPEISGFDMLHAYVLVGKLKGAVYATLSWFEEPIPIHLHLLEDEEKTEFLLECLSVMENINRVLSKTLSQTTRQLQGDKDSKKAKGRYAQLEQQAQTLFLEAAKNYVMGELTTTLEATHKLIDWEMPIKLEVGKRFKNMALTVFDSICSSLGTAAKTLEWRAVAQSALRKQIYGCLKGGWIIEREGKTPAEKS